MRSVNLARLTKAICNLLPSPSVLRPLATAIRACGRQTWFLSGPGGPTSSGVLLHYTSLNRDGRPIDARFSEAGQPRLDPAIAHPRKGRHHQEYSRRGDDRSPATVAGLRKLGNADQLVDFVRRMRTDLLIVTLPLTAEGRLLEVLKRLWVLPVDIRLSAYTQKLRYRPRAYSYVGNIPLVDVFDKPLSDWGQVAIFEDRIISPLR
jgi:hypothetical protein